MTKSQHQIIAGKIRGKNTYYWMEERWHGYLGQKKINANPYFFIKD